LVKSYQRYGATKTAIRYKTTRQLVYFWTKRFDGDIHSLADHSHKPHAHPKKRTDEELKWIRDMRRRSPDMGLVDFWLALRKRKSYKRSIASLFRVMRKLGMFPHTKQRIKRVNKPYEAALYPGQKIQSYVKFIPRECCVGALAGTKLYQFTAIDEYSVSVISRSSMSTILIPQLSFLSIVRISSNLTFTVFKRITDMSSPIVCAANDYPCLKKHCFTYTFAFTLFDPRHRAITERWSEVIGKINVGSMPKRLSIPSRMRNTN
jgi:hypothetical protein